MKFNLNYVLLLPVIPLAMSACSTSHKKSNDRAPASIREVASYLNYKAESKKKKFPKIKFLKDLKSPKKFEKITGIKIKRLNKSITSMSSDTNKDGKADLISKFKNGKLVSVKTDRNYDGKFDRFETLGHQIQKIKYDNDYNGKIDKILTRKPIASNRILETIYYPKTKKKHSYKQLTSHADSHNSEGKFCGDCESQFRKAVKDMRSPEAKERREAKWEEMDDADMDFFVKEPGYERTYLKIEPSIWLSDTCAYDYEEFVPMISDAINEYFDCMQNWGKIKSENPIIDKKKQMNANRLTQGFVEKLSSKENPLKINCERANSSSRAWAIVDHNSPNPTNIPKKDSLNSIVLNLTDLEENSEEQLKATILHEITHLHSGSHGSGVDNFHSCPQLCLGRKSLKGKEKLNTKNWSKLKQTFENVCLADRDINPNSSTNIDPTPYSYLRDIFNIYRADGVTTYKNLELGNQLIKEFMNLKNGEKIAPIQKIPKDKKEDLVKKYLMVSNEFSGIKTEEETNSFIVKNSSKINNLDMILPSLILTNSQWTIEKINDLIETTKNLKENEGITDDLFIISTLENIRVSLQQ